MEAPGEGCLVSFGRSAHTVRVLELAVLTSVGVSASILLLCSPGAQQVGATRCCELDLPHCLVLFLVPRAPGCEQPQGGCHETDPMPRLLSSWSWLVGLGQGSRVLDLHWPCELLRSLEMGHWGLACYV